MLHNLPVDFLRPVTQRTEIDFNFCTESIGCFRSSMLRVQNVIQSVILGFSIDFRYGRVFLRRFWLCGWRLFLLCLFVRRTVELTNWWCVIGRRQFQKIANFFFQLNDFVQPNHRLPKTGNFVKSDGNWTTAQHTRITFFCILSPFCDTKALIASRIQLTVR